MPCWTSSSTQRNTAPFCSPLNMIGLCCRALRRIPRRISSVSFGEDGLEDTQAQLRTISAQGQALAQKYDAVVTNPPYMGASNMNHVLSEFIKGNYTDYKSDFFSAFMARCLAMAKSNGYCGFFTPYVWMFIQSYEKLRQYLYTNCTIETLIQFEYSAFEEATVPVCTFVFQNRHIQKKGCYLRLVDFRGGMEVQRQKTLEAISNHKCGFYYEQSEVEFAKIPGSPVAYWLSSSMFNSFARGTAIGIVCFPAPRISNRRDNKRFLRLNGGRLIHNRIDFARNADKMLRGKKIGKYYSI